VLLGIAVLYPGGEGIDQDRAVIFSDNLESGSVADFSQRWTSIMNRGNPVLALIDDSTAETPGKRCLQMTAKDTTLADISGNCLMAATS
jgi:hypothetical protein